MFLHFMATQAREHRDAAINRHTQRNTILVVDDDLEIRSLLKILLEKTGYTVATAADGQEGLSFFVQHQSSIALLLTFDNRKSIVVVGSLHYGPPISHRPPPGYP